MSDSARSVAIRRRKPPEERRAEILEVAAELALAQGLERITLRAVSERLGVRPGLIGHYFPVAEDLVVEAFSLAIMGEREYLFAAAGRPTDRLAAFVQRVTQREADALAALWLNARHLSRFVPSLAVALAEQEKLDRVRLTALIAEGEAAGEFDTVDPAASCTQILVAVDGYGAYVNSPSGVEHPVFEHFVSDVCAWSLGIDSAAFREQVGEQRKVLE